MTNRPVRLRRFAELLRCWYLEHGRSFPWRSAPSSYHALVAEVMLRRTRAPQVEPVYRAFVRDYPNLSAAAAGDPEDIISRLSGLGLSWRGRDFVMMLQEASARFGEHLPTDRESLSTLPGVGDYVSGAVSCFAGNMAVPILDVNIVRVLSRVFGVDGSGEARRRKDFVQLADQALDKNDPAAYHYALIDFASLVCKAHNPKCDECVLKPEIGCTFAPGVPAHSE